ncbi:hypothetical protein BT96DRAFT_997022 [Gymnopus androsaceus JB14]|uniref:Uncharacterized protein n=1 Tax=Gymnopus androsaceus JB14 TaxID=1447944 RepID=A0A6A4HCN9_9AGAR|nr:hypothetical protein BT96DRAFT_997022 [Gymnopus androsaceus JB14]
MAKASTVELKKREQDQTRRWQVNLEKFTRWGNLVAGDWKGSSAPAAGLDEHSELGSVRDIEVEWPTKRIRHSVYLANLAQSAECSNAAVMADIILGI